MRETELAAKIVGWLSEQNWDVYQEVQFHNHGGVADIVAVRNRVLWIIETKMQYGFPVLNQAAHWPVHYRSVGVPIARNRDYRVALNYYKVGVIEVGIGVHEYAAAPFFSKHQRIVKDYLSQLTELHKTFAPAGSQSGHHLTPYKLTMMAVRKFVESHPGCTVKDIYSELGHFHYSSGASFKGNLLVALKEFESWCRVDLSIRPIRLYIKE